MQLPYGARVSCRFAFLFVAMPSRTRKDLIDGIGWRNALVGRASSKCSLKVFRLLMFLSQFVSLSMDILIVSWRDGPEVLFFYHYAIEQDSRNLTGHHCRFLRHFVLQIVPLPAANIIKNVIFQVFLLIVREFISRLSKTTFHILRGAVRLFDSLRLQFLWNI